MKFFLSLNNEGRQVFSVENGICSNLATGSQDFTHHKSFGSKYTMDTAAIVEVNRLPLDTLLSGPAIAKMSYPEGDNIIRAELGWLDMEVAPDDVELAMVIVFKENRIRSHSFLIGSKPKSYSINLSELDEEMFNNIDISKKYTVGVDFSTVLFPPMRKATEWKKIEEMLKDSFSGCTDFAKENVYARWRVLECKSETSQIGTVLTLRLEILPLKDKALKNHEAELLAKYNSSSNLAISVLNIPLKWRSPDDRRRLFTSPCLVVDPREGSISDSMVRLGMATVRDLLRMGRPSNSMDEHKSTISSPVVLQAWEKSRRELFMSEADAYEVIEKGRTILLLIVLDIRFSWYQFTQ